MSECDHWGFEACALRAQEKFSGREIPCPYCERDALAARLAEAEKLLRHARLFIDDPDIDAFLAPDSADALPELPPDTADIWCKHGVQTHVRRHCPMCEADQPSGVDSAP